ncbi:helix-turn-helix domain-containing protein [Maribacter sp.]|uniref:helix-turn-helix domain-containing protein n=1 Tax=Maribacter sp. TaxID=1897614 RepID=UPI0025B7D294|nr:helix-turn-helix domain-containing protein [Maribacter sp.]
MDYNLPHNIKVILTIHNLKQPDFGKMIGNSSGSSVSSWVSGVVKPSIEKIMMISEKFNISLDVLVFGEVGIESSQYDSFIKDNHPDLVNEKELREWKNNSIKLDDSILEDKETLGRLIVFWLKHHERLIAEDEVYRGFADSIGREYLIRKENEALKKKANLI